MTIPGRAVLVAGADTPTGLALARDLQGVDVPVIGAALTPAPTCRSNRWQAVVPVASPTEQAWLAALHTARTPYGRMVLLPADDAVVRIIAQHTAELATHFDFVLPDLATVDRLLDKAAFHTWAVANDLPVPHTAVVETSAELRAAMREMACPVAFKPFERTAARQAVSMRDKIRRFDSIADLDALPFDPFAVADRFVVQEWIPGRDSDVHFCLVYRDRDGRELAAQVGRKITQWPVDTGSSALCVTSENDELHDLISRVLDAAGHVGFGSLEVRRSSRDGRLLITEPTVGRPNLQTALATAAGVNLAAVAYRDALRMAPVATVTSRRAMWIHETAFPRSVVVAARRRRLDGKAVIRALGRRSSRAGAFLAVRDPLPLVFEVLRVVTKAAATILRRPSASG